MTTDERGRTELLITFRAELEERCQELTRIFLALEKGPRSDRRRELLSEAARSAHALKGAARVVGLAPVEALAHRLEGVFGTLRSEDVEPTPELFDLLYAVTDRLEGAVAVDGSLTIPTSEVEQLAQQLDAAKAGRWLERSERRRGDRDDVHQVAEAKLQLGRPYSGEDESGVAQHRAVETIRLPVAHLDRLLEQLGDLAAPRLDLDQSLATLSQAREHVRAFQRDWRIICTQARQLERARQSADVRTLLQLLDRNEARLAALISQLGGFHSRLDNAMTRLASVADALQSGARRFRMVPFARVQETVERAARDLARELAKRVRVTLIGGDQELDRRMLQELSDPLLQLVRNAVDHGIEPPHVRAQAGKPEAGRIVLSVVQRQGRIVVDVEDDGAGIDPVRVREVAVERGLVAAADAALLDDLGALELVFLPGFTTRTVASAVSGRGIGLDLVARRVEQLGGQVAVESVLGSSTRFRMLLPLTLATTRVVLVEQCGHRYALPTTAIERIRSVDRLVMVGGRLAIRHFGKTLFVHPLGRLLEEKGPSALSSPATVIVVESRGQQIGLAVDRVLGEQEIIVKPLGYPLVRVRHFSGATILGTGEVVLVLSVVDLVRTAMQASRTVDERASESPRRPARVLIADDSVTTRTLERHILEAAGYLVDVAADGAEALRMLHEQDYDVLVTDVTMPGIDGFELTTRVRREPRLQDLPVVLVTSRESAQDRQRGLDVGADAYVAKSTFDQDELLRTIQELV